MLRIFFRHEARRVETVNRLVEIEVTGVACARQCVFDFRPYGAVVQQTIERENDGVIHERFAYKNFRRVHGIDFPVAHGAAFEFEAVEARALLHHDASRLFVPKRFAVRHANDVRAEVERPQRVEAGAGARVEPRRLHHLRGHDPARSLRAFLGRRGGIGFTALRFFAPK